MSSSDDEIDVFRKKVLSINPTSSKISKKGPVEQDSDSDDSDSDDSDSAMSADFPSNYSIPKQELSSESESPELDTQQHKKSVKLKPVKTNTKNKNDTKVHKVTKGTKRKLKMKEEEPDQSEDEPEEVTMSNVEKVSPEDGEEYTAIREELSHMSFEELQKLRDRLGVKVYKQVMKGERKQTHHLSTAKRSFTRENKNRPMEASSKKPVSIYREVIPVKKRVSRDPRFDDMSGNYNEAIFKSSYAFLDDVKKREKEKLAKQLKKTKNDQKKKELQYLINRMDQQASADKQKQTRKELEKDWKKKELGRVVEGKNPYFLKKGDLRKLELAERFKELKKTGKLDKYMGKKRKKNASKEKKKLPD
ncbi:ribosomal RNA processing protein 36 homolog [Haliotis cracherodii]|uniref:ribosomal RNA processing protein 36 homolog n=1 Tax=Haliotis cracherodii TaxID=6455 RepID=UPI0039EC79B6